MQFLTFALTWLLVRLRTERGQDMIEYALLGGLVAAALIALFSLGLLSGGVNSMVTNIRDCIDFEAGTTCDISLP
jgi:Flp pilus assembly pilin Flp